MARFAHDRHHHHAAHDPQTDPGTPPVPPVTPPPTPPSTDPTPPASTAPAFADLGTTFNDATRALVGGLWQNVVEEGGQGHGSIGRYITDLTNVQTGLQ